jgi:MOSC domain-containing protein YiiM
MDKIITQGRVFQINISNGGVPKLAVDEAYVAPEGVSGDRQIHLHVHGGPERAVCLYSLEQILALQEEGHPIFAGAMGENVTVSGMDWTQVQPGRRMKLGEEILLEITRYTTPCSALKPYFKGGKFARVLQTKNPGWSRVYARVLQAGTLQVGAQVSLV